MDGVVLGPSAGAVAATRADAAALCIGVSANANSPLKNAVHDARDVTETLRRAGFAVTLLEDLRSVDALLEALEAFCARLQPGHTALFYFSGFGCQGDDGETYLMPAEEVPTDVLMRSKALSVQHVLERMQRAGCRLNMLVLDASRDKLSEMERSGDLSRGGAPGRAGGMRVAETQAPTDTVVAFACAPGKTARDGAGRNGVFTSHLLRHLTKPGMDVEFVLRNVAEGVKRETCDQQMPCWHNSISSGGVVCLVPTDTA